MEKYRNFVTSFYVIPIIYRIKQSFNLSVMKRSILIVFGLMLTALNGWSNDYNYLVFVTNTGPRSIAVEDLEMTVSDGKLVVRSGADGEAFDLSTLTKMYFSDAAVVSINDVEAGKVQSVSIHDLSGRLVGCYPSLDVARESLPKGVVSVASIACAARFLSENPGRALLTTGSKGACSLHARRRFRGALLRACAPAARCYNEVHRRGVFAVARHRHAGAFTRELNEAMLRQVGASGL